MLRFLNLNKVNKSFEGKQVFKNVHINLQRGDKLAVVGVNGAGKSTLLRVMAGVDKEFTGEAWAAEGAKVGYLEQEPVLDERVGRRAQKRQRPQSRAAR